MLAIEASRFRVSIKEDRLLVVDAELVTVIGSIVDSGPAQVLRHATGIAPPVSQTQLHVDVVLRSLGDHLIEVHEHLFIPLSGRESKVMIPRPVLEVGHRLNIVWTTFTGGPHAHDSDSGLRRLAQCLWHTRAIFVAIHHRDIRADKAKWFITDKETPAALAHKLILRGVRG